jgi:hypothetical protein
VTLLRMRVLTPPQDMSLHKSSLGGQVTEVKDGGDDDVEGRSSRALAAAEGLPGTEEA